MSKSVNIDTSIFQQIKELVVNFLSPGLGGAHAKKTASIARVEDEVTRAVGSELQRLAAQERANERQAEAKERE